MNRLISIAPLMVLGAILARAAIASQLSAPFCRVPSSAAEGFRLYITALDTGTTPAAANSRTFWHIPKVTASAITFASDSITCTRAAAVHAASLRQDTTTAAKVHVLRVGPTRYIAFNFSPVGEWFHYVILDSTYALVGTRGS